MFVRLCIEMRTHAELLLGVRYALQAHLLRHKLEKADGMGGENVTNFVVALVNTISRVSLLTTTISITAPS